MPLPGAFFSFVLYISVMDLPIDPVDFPGTPEYQEALEERQQRAYYLRLAALEEQMEEHALRRSSVNR